MGLQAFLKYLRPMILCIVHYPINRLLYLGILFQQLLARLYHRLSIHCRRHCSCNVQRVYVNNTIQVQMLTNTIRLQLFLFSFINPTLPRLAIALWMASITKKKNSRVSLETPQPAVITNPRFLLFFICFARHLFRLVIGKVQTLQ